jgi:hypothetical protein
MKHLTTLCLLVFLSLSAFSQANFSTSLHATRAGKQYWYGRTNGGFERLTNVPISQLGCVECHGSKNADGLPYPATYTPGCIDCHPSNSNFNKDSIKVAQCYGCHSRQAAEANTLGYQDVHRTRNMKCWDCHTSNDMHGTSTVYSSMLQPGAMEPDCQDCHTTLPANHSSYDPPSHNNKLHCSACHSRTVISCYSCHLESQIVNRKRAKQQIHGFVMLANRTKDNKIYPMSFQSLTYQGIAYVAFGPFTSHTITDSGRVCTDCHVNFGGTNAAITQYNTTGRIKFATWNSADSTLSWLRGIIPMPLDYRRALKMDFITYTGNPSDTVLPSKKWVSIGKETWDGHQMFFATPLTKLQMKKMGFDTTGTTSVYGDNRAPSEYSLSQNYPNPFNPATTIEFSLPIATDVTLKVFNLVGQEVRTMLLDQRMEAGVHKLSVKLDNLASGIYMYTLRTRQFTATKKMLVMK